MQSDRSLVEKKEFQFYKELRRILLAHGFGLDKVAQLCRLTSNQTYELRAGRRLPSRDVLRKLCEGLSRDLEPRELLSLMFYGVQLEELTNDREFRNILRVVPLSFAQQELTYSPSLDSRCVVSSTLGECISDECLAHTLEQMVKAGTFYFYFLPEGGTDQADLVLSRVMNQYPDSNWTTFCNLAYFIRCHPALFFSRLSVDNILKSDRRCYYSLGPQDSPVVLEVGREETEMVVRVLRQVVAKCIKARQEKSEQVVVTVGSEGRELRFELFKP